MQRLEFELEGISIEGTILDIETVALEPEDNGIFTVGYLSGNKIRIVQAEDASDCEKLTKIVRDGWEKLPKPIYAYNKEFAENWLRHVLDADIAIDRDLMKSWKSMAEQQSLKWPRLRELIRPPVFYYRWGLTHYDRERDVSKLKKAINQAGSVNEVISREAIGGVPHIWWQEHLEAMKDSALQVELASLNGGEDDKGHSPTVYRLPNGHWTTTKLAAIVCHNMMDLQAEASLLIWQWGAMSKWLEPQ